MKLALPSERGEKARTSLLGPISSALDVVGDRRSLLVVRGLLFEGTRTYSELLASPEGIATNVHADRLDQLEAAGIIEARSDATDGSEPAYIDTEIARRRRSVA